jgi:uncharacterized membrane protein
MIAHTAAIPGRRRWRFPLWIPILLVWLVLLPFVLLLTPLVFVACLALGVNPARGVAVFWQLFSALRGVRIEVSDPCAPISIRIF